MNVSFEGRASSSRYDQVIMGVGVINSSNMKYLGFKRPYDYQDTGISTPHDTGYNSFSYNFNTTSADEILLFLCYIEATAAYWNQSVWFRNLVVSFNGTIFTPIPPVPTITMNNSFVIMTLFTVIIFAATIKASKKIKKYS